MTFGGCMEHPVNDGYGWIDTNLIQGEKSLEIIIKGYAMLAEAWFQG